MGLATLYKLPCSWQCPVHSIHRMGMEDGKASNDAQ